MNEEKKRKKIKLLSLIQKVKSQTMICAAKHLETLFNLDMRQLFRLRLEIKNSMKTTEVDSVIFLFVNLMVNQAERIEYLK